MGLAEHVASFEGATVKTAAIEIMPGGSDDEKQRTGVRLDFEDGRALRVWSPFECPEEIEITIEGGT